MENKALAKTWDERNRLWSDIHQINSPTYHFRETLIQSLLPIDGEGKKALDVGCGTGEHVCQLLLRGFSVDAIDPSPYAISVTREKAEKIGFQCSTHVCGIEDFEEENTYDFILASEVLEHVEDDSSAIKKISEYLGIGGKTLITVPHNMKLWSASDDVSGHLRRYAKDELREKLETAGLKVITLTCYGFPFLQGLFQIRKFITSKEGIKREEILQERITKNKLGHFFFRILNKVSLIDRLNLFPDKGIGLIALVEKKG
jgi:2-polyprenyl-3-methyl-5-hydroxy-6-metoxy-1,4-benzoquinol methylase